MITIDQEEKTADPVVEVETTKNHEIAVKDMTKKVYIIS